MFAFGRNLRQGVCRKRWGCSSCLAFEANGYWHVQLSLLYKNTGSKAYDKRIPDFGCCLYAVDLWDAPPAGKVKMGNI